ncbi:MAG: bifunctional diguanylate cyclase/phosphodiesterase [Actinomycetota bacterium]|nr:bifunctional diguanylate cyclase/phosphodiesterase [Actinomycetota bacterium]
MRTEIRVVEGEHGEDVLEVTAVDVHQTKLIELEVSRLLLIDALTGLASRRGLEQAWEERCAEGAARMAGEAEAEPPQAWAVLAQIDIDRFGVVNAGLGMVAGDEMLRVIGERLRALAGEGATVARMGADDFVVLVSGLATMADAYALAVQLVGSGAEPVRIGVRDVYSTVSVGATLLEQRAFGSGARLDEHLAEAHVALRAAKARNGNCVELFAEGMRAAAQSNIETHSALRHGIEARQFVLHYQPIVDLETREVVGAEALVRWQHPTRGLLLPSEFIPLAEETGAIVELGDYVIEEACRAAARWPAGPRGELTVAVNLSARQLLSPELVTRISRALESSGLAPERLVLEITETSVIYDLDGAGWTLRLLAEMGVHFALDDFGTGYSSLAYLVQLPIDRVKVDRSLVAGLPRTSGSQAVIAGVVGMTRAMGFHVIAEGVETEDQIDALNGLACHLAQGFLFSPPVSERRFLRLATRQSPVG